MIVIMKNANSESNVATTNGLNPTPLAGRPIPITSSFPSWNDSIAILNKLPNYQEPSITDSSLTRMGNQTRASNQIHPLFLYSFFIS